MRVLAGPIPAARFGLAHALRLLARALTMALACMASLALSCHAVQAESPPAVGGRHYSIAAGPLSGALAAFAVQAGVSVSYVPGLVDGKLSPALYGDLSIEQALANLLAGSGLYASSPSAGTYVILREPEPVPAPAMPAAAGNPAATNQLPTITVSSTAAADLGYHDEGFVAETTRAATRTDTPIAELPQAVEVVTRDAMRSQQTQSVAAALDNISGVSVEDQGIQGLTVYVRGLTAPLMRDGDVDLSGLSMVLPVAAIERIEVLKGADSIVAGPMSPGGVVNIVTKKPQAEPVRDLSVQAGSYGDWLASVDMAGALSPDHVLTYRFVMSGERAGQNSYGYDGMRDFYVAPSLGVDYRGTHLVVGLEQNAHRLPQTAFTVLGPQGPYPLSTPIGRPDDGKVSHGTSLYYDFAQDLGKDWTFHSKARYTREVADSSFDFLEDVTGLPGVTSGPDPSGVQGMLSPDRYSSQFHWWGTEQSMTGKIRIGPVSQTVTAGFSYSQGGATTVAAFGSPFTLPLGAGATLPPIDTLTSSTADVGKQYDSNLFLQDQISVGRLRVLASIGHPREWGQQSAMASAWTPNLGLLYQLTNSVAVYINALRSFVPQPGLPLETNGLAPPLTGSSFEAGAKFSLLDDRLTMTAAVFRAAEKNVATLLPDGSGLYTLSPGDVSRGVEFDATGQLLPGLNLIASYTYSHYLSVANGFSQLPKHQGSFWVTYDLQGEHWHGWGAGVGMWARSGYLATSYTGDIYPMPGQARTDASIYYRAKRWSTTLGVKNVFDRRLYGDYASSLFVVEEPGRLIYLTSTYRF